MPSHPQDAGNRSRIFQLAATLRSLGCDPHFAYCDLEGGDLPAMRAYWGDRLTVIPCRSRAEAPDHRGRARRLWAQFARREGRGPTSCSSVPGAGPGVDDWMDLAVDERVLGLHARESFQAIWVEYVFFSRVLERFGPPILRVIDTHDVFAGRHELLMAHGLPASWFSTSPEEEARGLRRADVVIAIQDNEAAHFRSLGGTPVLTIGHLLPDPPIERRAAPSGTVVFVASDNPINVDAWRHFAATVLPRVAAQVPRLTVGVAGRICACIPDHPSCVKHGVVGDLGPLYAAARVAVNPVLFGSGLKIKSLEPLAFGCPVVTTPAGVTGIEEARDRGILVGSKPDEVASHLIRLCSDAGFHALQRSYALEYAGRYRQRNRLRLERLLRGGGVPAEVDRWD